jgi:hypothetical protein
VIGETLKMIAAVVARQKRSEITNAGGEIGKSVTSNQAAAPTFPSSALRRNQPALIETPGSEGSSVVPSKRNGDELAVRSLTGGWRSSVSTDLHKVILYCPTAAVEVGGFSEAVRGCLRGHNHQGWPGFSTEREAAMK